MPDESVDHGTSDHDTRTGGAGADTFAIAPAPGNVVITDFTDFTDGDDVVDLSAFSTIAGFSDLTITAGADGVTIDLTAHGGGTILLQPALLAARGRPRDPADLHGWPLLYDLGWDADWSYWFARQGQPTPDLSQASGFRLCSMLVQGRGERHRGRHRTPYADRAGTRTQNAGPPVRAGLAASGSSSRPVDLTAPVTAGRYCYGACVVAVTDESDTTNNCSGSVEVTVSEPEQSAPGVEVDKSAAHPPVQADSTSNRSMLRVRLLNSTPIRWIGSRIRTRSRPGSSAANTVSRSASV